MDNNPLDDIDEEKVDHLIPEGLTPPGGVEFSAKAQQDQFLSGISSAKENSQKERKIASTIEELPPLQDGFVRLIHATNPETAEEVARTGLDYSAQGMVQSTARAYAKPDEIDYYTDDPRFAWGISVILDLPEEEYRLHDDLVKSPGVVPAEYVVGIIDSKRPEQSKV